MQRGPLTAAERKRLLPTIAVAVEKFHSGDWLAVGTHTGCHDIIDGHPRLLRSLSFGDPDYAGCAHAVMLTIVERDHQNMNMIEDYIAAAYGSSGLSISSAPSQSRPITFTPGVFDVPDYSVEADLIAVMMPFSPEFEVVFEAINAAGFMAGYRSLRAKDIWDHTTVIQDIFSLIYRSNIVVCDFTGKN